MRRSRLLLVAASSALIAACSYKPSFINEYKIDIQQGNVLTQDMVAQLKPGQPLDLKVTFSAKFNRLRIAELPPPPQGTKP